MYIIPLYTSSVPLRSSSIMLRRGILLWNGLLSSINFQRSFGMCIQHLTLKAAWQIRPHNINRTKVYNGPQSDSQPFRYSHDWTHRTLFHALNCRYKESCVDWIHWYHKTLRCDIWYASLRVNSSFRFNPWHNSPFIRRCVRPYVFIKRLIAYSHITQLRKCPGISTKLWWSPKFTG